MNLVLGFSYDFCLTIFCVSIFCLCVFPFVFSPWKRRMPFRLTKAGVSTEKACLRAWMVDEEEQFGAGVLVFLLFT